MTLKRNVITNYVGQFYVTGINIVMLPVYLHFLGREAYGLVGFFAVLNGWLSLLDMGITLALEREVARFRGGEIGAKEFRSIFQAVLVTFLGIGIGVVALVWASAGFITSRWLKIETLSFTEVRTVVILMGITFAIRWLAGTYRSVMNGFEKQVWLNVINIGIATFRFVCIIPVLLWLGPTPKTFFYYQVFSAIVELMLLAYINNHILPAWPEGNKQTWDISPIVKIWPFAFGLAFLSFNWTLLTQTDKLILTKLLPLSDYACIAIAVTAAGGVLLLNGPILQAVLPRLTRLAIEKDIAGLKTLYRKTTRIVCVIAGSGAVVCAMFAQPLLWTWTGDLAMAENAATVLKFYAIGNGFFALSTLQNDLQFAHGDLRLEVRLNILFPIFLIPCIIWATLHYGMSGASVVWMLINIIFILAWSPIVHHRFLPGLHKTWLAKDVLPVVAILILLAFIMGRFPLSCESRVQNVIILIAWYIFALTGSALVTNEGRTELKFFKTNIFKKLGMNRNGE